MKIIIFTYGIIVFTFTQLYSQIPNKNIDDSVIIKCLEKLSQKKYFKTEKEVISIYEQKSNVIGERSFIISNFITDLKDVNSNSGQILGTFNGDIVLYKSYKENGSRISATEVAKLRDDLDDNLVGNKEEYAKIDKILAERFVDKNGKPLKLDKSNNQKIVYTKGFSANLIVRTNGNIEITYL
jgi:hypothetical protein